MAGKFGNGKSVPNQGGIAPAHVLPTRVEDKKSADTGVSTPDLGKNWASSVNQRPTPVGGSNKGQSAAGGPKPFKK